MPLRDLKRAVAQAGRYNMRCRLSGQVFTFLTDLELVEFSRADEVADAIMELAKANQSKLAEADGARK